MTDQIYLYDTTLRDGSQAEGISFSLADKLRVTEKLDQFGIHYIEGGWPGSNPKDVSFFKEVRRLNLNQAKIAAFGSTRRPGKNVREEMNIVALLEAETPVVTIFGKSWSLHVEKVLGTTFDENLKMIEESVSYLKSHGREVVYDAEHFFDGFLADTDYALKTLLAAQNGGADWIVLCDTNGGMWSSKVKEIVDQVKNSITIPLGIHVHNDSGMAVANSITAVEAGVRQVQGTINGYGERCGNANLITIIPNFQIKLGYPCISADQLKNLSDISRFVDELANQKNYSRAPFVGKSAFAHKGGMHVNAVRKIAQSFEHIDPVLIGNHRRILVSELSGKSNIFLKSIEKGVRLDENSKENREIIEQLKILENEGYEFEAAEASFFLLIQRILKKHKPFFELDSYRVMTEQRENPAETVSEATIKIRVNSETVHTVAEGDGPVNALDKALRKALVNFYPQIKEVVLADYKVRVLDATEATAAKVRVLIESRDAHHIWGTVGVSENVIEASWEALVDSVEYKLWQDEMSTDESA